MKLVELMVARNEAHIVGFSLRAALRWVDEAVVLDHASTDQTPKILREIREEVGDRLVILTEPDPEWRQFEYRQRLLDTARGRGATHLAILDADEVLTGDLVGGMRELVERLGPAACVSLPMRCIWGSPFQVRTGNFRFANYAVSAAFQDCPHLFWKAEKGYDHDHREPHNLQVPKCADVGTSGMMHFQWLERSRVLAKHALYKMEHRVRWAAEWPPERLETQYNASIDETGLEVQPTPPEWFASYSDIICHLKLGEEPWQAAECKRLWKEYGPARFAGLTLWGVTG